MPRLARPTPRTLQQNCGRRPVAGSVVNDHWVEVITTCDYGWVSEIASTSLSTADSFRSTDDAFSPDLSGVLETVSGLPETKLRVPEMQFRSATPLLGENSKKYAQTGIPTVYSAAGFIRLKALFALAGLLLALIAIPIVLASPRFAEVRKAPLSISSYKKVFASRSARASTIQPTPFATSYTWNVAGGTASWATAGNWLPSRTTPANDDVLIFNNGFSNTVTNVPAQTVGQVVVSSGTTVNLQADAVITLTISGGGGVDLDVQAGSQLNCNTTNSITIAVATGATGSISGSMTFSAGSATAHSLTADDASGITFNNGSSFTQGTNNLSNVFGASAPGNTIIFASGSTFNQLAGSNPFALTQPASKVVFQTGSWFRLKANLTPSFSGRTYGNFEFNAPSGSPNASGGSALSIDDLTGTSATLNVGMTGTFNIKGNLSVASGGGLNFNPSPSGTVTFNGSSAQSISGAGSLTMNTNQAISFANTAGVTLQRNLTTNAVTVSSGTLNCGTNVIGGGNSSFTLSPGATLGIGSVDGISSGSLGTGNIQTVSKTFSSSANYTYNGTLPQVTGTGPGFNSTQGTINSLTVTNTAGVTLSQNTTINGASSIGSGATLNTGAFALTVSNTLTNSGTLNVSNGGTLKGTGTVSGPVSVASGGAISPGNSPGIINTGNATFTSGSNFNVEIGGTTAGTQYDQLNVTGTITLGNANLNLTQINSFAPSLGNSFTIINNDSNDAVNGVFTQGTGGTDLNGGTLAEGDIIANFLGSTLNAKISYIGGDSNDVVISVLCPTSLTVNDTGDGADASAGNGVCETASGNGICTLRAAIQEANALSACSGTIDIGFSVSGTITLSSALPGINHDVNINGPGASSLTVNGSNSVRPFLINGGKTVSISNLTVTNGLTTTDNGGGIRNDGTLTLTGVVISNNSCTSGGPGGGIYNASSLTVTDSTFSGNSSNSFGGGIAHGGTTLNLSRSTFVGNSSSASSGGGVNLTSSASGSSITNCTFYNNTAFSGGALSLRSTATLTNSTVTGNKAAVDGGINVFGAANVVIVNTIVALNTDVPGTTPSDLGTTSGGTVVTGSSFNNLIGTGGSAGLSNGTNGNQVGVANPFLAPLGNYGGLTQTMGLLSTSTAINNGTSTGAPATDQRGVSRPQPVAGNFDIGAFEANSTLTVNPSTLPNGTNGVSYTQNITATGGNGNYTFIVASGSLPTGLNLSSGGALTGTPTVSGTYNFIVLATDTTGAYGDRSYSITISNPSLFYRSIASGNWNATSTWESSSDNSTWLAAAFTPTSADQTVTVRSPHTVTVTANVDADQLTVDSGATLSVNNGVTFTIADGTGVDLTGNGTVATAGTIANNGTFAVNGNLQVNNGGSETGTAPTYGSSSALVYNTSSGFNVGNEWTGNSTTAGAGVPQNVTVQASSGTVTMPTTTRGLAGNLTISSGTLALSTSGGAGLNVAGNWDNTNGALTPNGRVVTFNGAGLQTITTGGAGAGKSFAGLVVTKSGSATLAGALKANGLTVTAGTLDTSSNNYSADFTGSVFLSGGGILKGNASAIGVGGNWTASGGFTADTSTVTFNGSGNAQTISSNNTFKNLTIDNVGGSVTASGTLAVGGLLHLVHGAFTSATSYAGVTIDSGATLALSGDITVSGNWTNNGTFTANGFATTFNGSTNQSSGGNSTTNFATLSISNTGSSPTNVVLLAQTLTADQINITAGVLDQGSGANIVSGPGPISVSAGATYRNFGVGQLKLYGDVINNGTINFNSNGAGCPQTDSIQIRSSSSGVQRSWSGSGTFSMTDVSVEDQGGTAIIGVRSGTNVSGNGLNWLFVSQCSAYTWTQTVNTDWTNPLNWSPARTTVAASDILFFGPATPTPTATNVAGIAGGTNESIAELHINNGVAATFSTGTGPNTLTIDTGSAVPGFDVYGLTLTGASALTIKLGTTGVGTLGSVTGPMIVNSGPHRLIGQAASAITFQNNSTFRTDTGFTGNVFGDGSSAANGAAGSMVFSNGSTYFHNAGGSPFGASGNPSVVTFQTGSEADYLIAGGFDASGRTYANLVIGDGSGVVNASQSGAGSFQFDNLTVKSNGTTSSSLTYTGSGPSAVTIRGNILSTGVGSGSLPDVMLTAGTGGIQINKPGGGALTFSNSGNGRSIDLESNATLDSGTTLNLGRIVQMGFSPTKVFTANGPVTPNSGAPGYIIGNEKKTFAAVSSKTFEVGTVDGYSPVTANVTSGTFPADFTAKANTPKLPALPGTNALQRYWTLTATGLTANLTFNYLAGDVVGTEANYKIVKYDGSFTQFTPDVLNTGSHFATKNGVSSFSDWTLAEPGAVVSCPGTLTVDDTGDDPDANAGDGICATTGAVCTLRAAIMEANALTTCGAIDINFSVTGSITVGSTFGAAFDTIGHNVNINGPGADQLFIDGNGSYRIFVIGSGKTVTIDGLELTNASAVGMGENGAAILNNGTLTVTNSIFSDNQTPNNGAGIYNNGGTVTVRNSTFVAQNSTATGGVNQNGGAIYNDGTVTPATLTIVNSTFSGNYADNSGGAIFNDGTGGSAIITITNSTISRNSASASGALGEAGGIRNNNGTVNVRNTIIGGNFNTGSTSYDVFGSFNSLGHNLISISDGSTGFTASGDQVGTLAAALNPGLGFLQNNGGTTPTMSLSANSPAIDAGDDCVLTNACSPSPLGFNLTVDQRGVTRPQSSLVDIGAVEIVTYVVNTTADHASDICEALSPGHDCTLREAIEAANLTSGSLIQFAIPTGVGGDPGCDVSGVCTISPTLALGNLPDISETVFIDGYSQPGASKNTKHLDEGDDAVLKIVLDGSNILANGRGLNVVCCGEGSLFQGLVINHWTEAGIAIADGIDHTIAGNFIGTDVTGGTSAGNAGAVGILITGDSEFNEIGGDAPAMRNVISGNGTGIKLDGSGVVDTTIEGNYIGTNRNATAIPTGGGSSIGIRIQGDSSFHTIGCEVIDGDNVISGNSDSGISIEGGAYNQILGNLIGTDRTGATAIANGKGVVIIDSTQNSVGVNIGGAFGSLISGNTAEGILIKKSTLSGSMDNFVQSNLIGTNAAGTLPLSNGGAGVKIDGASGNLIGGDTANDGNLISGNTEEGVEITGGASDNLVKGNYIGVAVNGTSPLGNGGSGVEVYTSGSSNNIIGNESGGGGTFRTRKDSAQNASGKDRQRAGARPRSSKRKSPMASRFASKAPLRTPPLAIQNRGLRLLSIPSVGNTSGANIIANNGVDGVRISNAGDINNLVSENSIYSNTGLGINLGTDGVTPNDLPANLDVDDGPNHLQNFPILQTAAVSTQQITGVLHSKASNSYTIHFYANPTCDGSGNGEGKTFIGSTSTGTDGSGDGPFSFTAAPASFSTGQVITATATDNNNNTSEFSVCFTATTSPPGSLQFSSATYTNNETNADHTFNVPVTRTGGTGGAVAVTYTVSDGTATTVDNDYVISPASGSLNWADGDSAVQNIQITIKGDTNFEGDETINISLSSPTNGASLGTPNSAVLTITNDDSPVISGHVGYCTSGLDVPGVLVSVTGSQTTSTTTNSSGNFSLTLPVGGNYTLTPSKSALSPGSSSINTVDVVAAQNQFLYPGSLTGCQLTAADADESSGVNTIDVIAIQHFFLSQSSTANVGQWRFNPANRGYTNLGANQTAQDHTALVIGDVNANLTPPPRVQGDAGQPAPNAVATVSLPVDNISTNTTNFTENVLTTNIDSADNLVGFQGDFTFDSSVVTFQGTPTSPAGLTASNWNVSASVLGAGTIKTLRVSAFSTNSTPLSGSGTLFKLNFTRVSNTLGANTPLTWAAAPDNFFFIAQNLSTQAPTSTPAGSITIVGPSASVGDISGRILDAGNNPVEGAGVRMSGMQNRLTVTDATGNYHFDNVDTNGFYTVTPARANFSFSPSQRSFSQLGQHTDAAFSATGNSENASPLDRTEYFVRQQYVDFLNREPDEAGLSFWVNNIESCGADATCREAKRTDTSAAFFLSIEFQQTGYLVYRTYQAAFGDLPGAPVPVRLGEFQPDTRAIGANVVVNQGNWQQTLEANKQAYMTSFVARSRFISAYPTTMTPAEFVDKLFANAGVLPTEAARSAAIDEFGSASTSSDTAARARALRRVAENAALAQKEFGSAFVLMQYFGYLRRDADATPDTSFSGFEFWLTKLNNFNGNYQQAEMVRAFLVSTEYRGRFPR